MCVVGSCNGLVCLHNNSYYEFNVVIWNFATKETKVVPKSNLPRLSSGHCSRYEVIGFGFDAKTNDYKISNLLSLYDPNSFQSELCSLSADSWREVDSPPCVIRADFRAIDSYINGMASWEASLDDWEGVLTFHMSDEVFLKTPLPDDVIYYNWRYFFWLNESIAMAVSIYEWLEICFDIWLLLEVGVKDSWTKLFTIGPFTRIDRPLGFWKNDTMFLQKYNGQLVLYDPSTKEMTDLQIHADIYSLQLITYMETLVSVKGGNEFQEQHNC